MQDIIEVPTFYHQQWAPEYPEFVNFRYDGTIYQIRLEEIVSTLREIGVACTLDHTPPEQQMQEVAPNKFPPQDHHEGRHF